MIDSLAGLVTEDIRLQRPSDDGMALDMQLAHVHQTRRWWLRATRPELLESFGRAVTPDGEAPIHDLAEMKSLLKESAAAVRSATIDGLEKGGSFGPYDNAVLFLQHMVWHEGYHAALILLALRIAGFEPSEEWEEKHIWELWRGVEVWEG
jgi:uncharacterized damage-inducible protein DinB